MSGLYNALFGWNPACVLLAPMLTDENPQSFFPRFRDCFLSDDKKRKRKVAKFQLKEHE